MEGEPEGRAVAAITGHKIDDNLTDIFSNRTSDKRFYDHSDREGVLRPSNA